MNLLDGLFEMLLQPFFDALINPIVKEFGRCHWLWRVLVILVQVGGGLAAAAGLIALAFGMPGAVDLAKSGVITCLAGFGVMLLSGLLMMAIPAKPPPA